MLVSVLIRHGSSRRKASAGINGKEFMSHPINTQILEMKQEMFEQAIKDGLYHDALAVAQDTKTDFPEQGMQMLEQLRSMPLDLFAKPSPYDGL